METDVNMPPCTPIPLVEIYGHVLPCMLVLAVESYVHVLPRASLIVLPCVCLSVYVFLQIILAHAPVIICACGEFYACLSVVLYNTLL